MDSLSSDEGKLFIGGISWETSEEKLKEYFGNYGDISQTVIMRDKISGRPRGFGFVVFSDPSVLDNVLQQKHTIDGRTVEAKRALSREEQQVSKAGNGSGGRSSGGSMRTKKIFVGGLPPTLSEEGFRQYFEAYGQVTDVVVMYDQQTNRPRGFGFISFDSEDAVDRVLHKTFHDLNGKQVEVKRALPKDANPGGGGGGGRSMGGGGYQGYGSSGGNSGSYESRMGDSNRYMQSLNAGGGGGFPSYGSSGYGNPGYGYGPGTNGMGGYNGYGSYGGGGGGRSMGSGGYQGYGSSGWNSGFYEIRMGDSNRYMQSLNAAGGGGFPSYWSLGYGNHGYGHGLGSNGMGGYNGHGSYGGGNPWYWAPTGAPYGNPNAPSVSYGSAPSGAARSSWNSQPSSGYGGAGAYGNAPWPASGAGGPQAVAPTGQSSNGAVGYGNQGYVYGGGYGGNDGSYGNPAAGYGAVGGRIGSAPNSNSAGYGSGPSGAAVLDNVLQQKHAIDDPTVMEGGYGVDILINILSRLDCTTYEGFRTTAAISEVWRNIWTSLPHLIFSDVNDGVNSRKEACFNEYISFIDYTIKKCPTNLNLKTFKLHIDYSSAVSSEFKSLVNSWIHHAISRNVEEVDLQLYDSFIYDRGSFIYDGEMFFNNPCFKHVKLSYCLFDPPNGVISWEKLKFLCLSCVTLDEKMIEKILCGSPCLESLELDDCYGYGRIEISSRSVKKLVFSSYLSRSHYRLSSRFYFAYAYYQHRVEIKAPYISSLTIKGELVLRDLVLSDVPSLVKADLSYCINWDEDVRLKIFRGLLESLAHVEDITYGEDCLQLLSRLEAGSDTSDDD